MISLPMRRTSGSSVVKRSCSSRWSVSELNGAHDVLEGQVLAVLLGDERPLLVVVEHHRVEVEGQVVGLPLVGGRRLDGRRLHRRGGRRVGGRRCGGLGGGFGLGGHLFQERILEQLLLHDLLQLERGELQELDGLLQQRGHDDPLALSE